MKPCNAPSTVGVPPDRACCDGYSSSLGLYSTTLRATNVLDADAATPLYAFEPSVDEVLDAILPKYSRILQQRHVETLGVGRERRIEYGADGPQNHGPPRHHTHKPNEEE